MIRKILNAYALGRLAGISIDVGTPARDAHNPFVGKWQFILREAWFIGWSDGMTQKLSEWLSKRNGWDAKFAPSPYVTCQGCGLVHDAKRMASRLCAHCYQLVSGFAGKRYTIALNKNLPKGDARK